MNNNNINNNNINNNNVNYNNVISGNDFVNVQCSDCMYPFLMKKKEIFWRKRWEF